MGWVKLTCPAKVNFSLRVLGRRPDGYHEVQTVLHTVDLADTLWLRARGRGTRLRCSVPSLEGDENLVWRAVELFRRETGSARGVEVYLRKRVPIAAGLGGGSSDAGTVLRALNHLWSVGLDDQALERLASRLGSDVPFFVRGGCALAVGRGDRVSPLPVLGNGWVVIVNPRFPLSASQVYGWLPEGLTSPRPAASIASEIIGKGDVGAIAGWLANDLEEGLLPRYPLLRHLKKELVRSGALGAVVSGSGPSVYGLCATREAAQKVARSVSGPGRVVFVSRPVGPLRVRGSSKWSGQQPLEL